MTQKLDVWANDLIGALNERLRAVEGAGPYGCYDGPEILRVATLAQNDTEN